MEKQVQSSEMPKNKHDAKHQVNRLLTAVKPFVKALNNYEVGFESDDKDYQEFLDSNLVVPKMTMGDFRKLAKAYQEAS